jgi:hypothetical protein
MERDELSLGNEFTAAITVLNSPDVVVPARTTIAPEGGEIRKFARAAWHNERMTTSGHMLGRNTLFVCIFVSSRSVCRRPLN